MNKFRLILIILISNCLGLVASEWTILIYMAADNGLHDYALEDIAEMELSSFSSQANIIVEMDGDANSDLSASYRYKITENPQAGIQSPIIANLGERNSGSYLTLKNFVEWGFNRYKSSKKALIIWSHGNGWAKDKLNKGIAPDNTSQSFISMSNHEMQAALSEIELDLLIYDACNMQTIENLIELEGRADYIIGSEATVPSTGLPYGQIFDYWQEATDIDSLAINIPKIYVEAYRPGNIYNSGPFLRRVTSSTANMSKLSTFKEDLNAFLTKWSSDPRDFIIAREDLNEFGITSTDVDLKELLDNLSVTTSNNDLQEDCLDLSSKLDSLFISYDSSSFDYKVGPASIWFPKYSWQFANNWQIYRMLHFAQGAIGNFLNKFLAPDEIPPFPFEITKSQVINETIYLEWENHLDPDPLNYQITFDFNDGTSQIINLENLGSYQTSVKENGQVYILAQDAAGNQTKSSVLDFEIGSDYGKLYLAPNPIRKDNEGKIIFYAENSGGKKAEISLFSLSGKVISKARINLPEGINEHKIDLSDIIKVKLSSGIYLCSLKIENKYYKTKFAVEY
jgi:hypothetical protein